MPDYAPNYTPRYRARYQSAGVSHTIMIRASRAKNIAETISLGTGVLYGLFNALAAILPDDFGWLGAAVIDKDSDLSLPATAPAPVIGAVDTATLSGQDKITSLGFVGRSATGSPARLFIYGCAFSPDAIPSGASANFRITYGEQPQVADGIDFLGSAGELVAVDNGGIYWHQYCNLKVNDYWLKRLRTGAVSS